MARILVIDDDRAVAFSVSVMLEYEGHEVAVAHDGRSGIAALESERFDAAIIDIFMPGMDGFETITAIRARRPDLPIIAITGFMARDADAPAADFLAMAIKLGADYGLNKPFRRRDIVEAVAACLGGPAAGSAGRTAVA